MNNHRENLNETNNLEVQRQALESISLLLSGNVTSSMLHVEKFFDLISKVENPIRLLLLQNLLPELINKVPGLEVEIVQEYVFFLEASKGIMEDMNETTISLRKFAKEYMDRLDPNQKKDDDIHKLKNREYEKIWRLFTSMNYKNIENYEFRRLKELEMTKSPDEAERRRAKIQRKEGVKILPSQLHELKTFTELKLGTIQNESIELTYKRFITEKGKIKKVSFEQFEELTLFLRERIEKDVEVAHKNIQYYKLENNMGFETVKAIAKSIEGNMLNASESDKRRAIMDLLQVLLIPILTYRESYIDLYFKDKSTDKIVWKKNIYLILYAIMTVVHIRKCTNSLIALKSDSCDMKRFKTIYSIDSITNGYRPNQKEENFCDFSQKTFQLVMEGIQEYKNLNHKRMSKKNNI